MTPALPEDRGELPPAVLELAARALRLAELDSMDRARRVVDRIVREHGPDMVVIACLAWCDELLRSRPEVREAAEADRLVGLMFRNLVDDSDRQADHVPPPVRWAGRFLHARARFDEHTGKALVAACRDEREWGTNVLTLLDVVATTRTNRDVPALVRGEQR